MGLSISVYSVAAWLDYDEFHVLIVDNVNIPRASPHGTLLIGRKGPIELGAKIFGASSHNRAHFSG